MSARADRLRMWQRLYMPIAIVLVLFGVVALFSIGFPFFVVGLALLFLWPLRHRTRVFVPILVGVLAFVVVSALVAPLGCTASVTSTGGAGHTSCDNLIGLRYAGTGTYNPSLWPAVASGAVAAALVGLLAYLGARRWAHGSK